MPPDRSSMESIGLLFPLAIIAFLLIVVTKKSLKTRKLTRKRKRVIENGTLVSAQIIGVAQGDIDGRSWANLKISYAHPFTKQETIAYASLGSDHFADDRIYKLGLPHLSRITKTTISSWKYNQKLYTSYRQQVNARSIPEQEKKQLLREAITVMSIQYEHPPKDHEGYHILTPPVPAEGYMVGDEIEFLQKTNIPILHDWTQGLR